MKTHLKNYIFFFASSFLKLILFYYIARRYDQHGFVQYSIYLYCSDIILVLASSGTYTFFSIKEKVQHRLEAAVLFENSAIVVGIFVIYLMRFLGHSLINDSINLSILGLLTWGRVNNQIFSRYFLFFHNIPRSLINDVLGNYLWIVAIFIWLWLFPSKAVETLLGMWIFFSFVVNFFNYWNHRNKLDIGKMFSKNNMKTFLSTYLMAIQFVILDKNFSNLEKIIAMHKFDNISLISSYVFACKIVSYLVEITTAFTAIVMANNLVKLDVKKSRFFKLALIINSCAFALILIGLLIFSRLILRIFGTQISAEYLSLLLLVIPVYALTNLHGLMGVYFQRHQKLKYLNVIAFCQLLTLCMLYFMVKNIYIFVIFQIGVWGLFLLADFIYKHNIEKKEYGIRITHSCAITTK